MGTYVDIYCVYKDGTIKDLSHKLDLCLKHNTYMIERIEAIQKEKTQRMFFKGFGELDVLPKNSALVLCDMELAIWEHCVENSKPYNFKKTIEVLGYRHEFSEYKNDKDPSNWYGRIKSLQRRSDDPK